MPYGGATQPMNKVCAAASLALFTQKKHICALTPAWTVHKVVENSMMAMKEELK